MKLKYHLLTDLVFFLLIFRLSPLFRPPGLPVLVGGLSDVPHALHPDTAHHLDSADGVTGRVAIHRNQVSYSWVSCLLGGATAVKLLSLSRGYEI